MDNFLRSKQCRSNRNFRFCLPANRKNHPTTYEAESPIWSHRRRILPLSRPGHNEFASGCRRKVRMSGLCKVEMSAFMDGRGAHGNGANRVEPARTGPIESVAPGTAEAVDAGSSGRAVASKRPPGAADAAAPAPARRSLPGSRTARPAIEPQAGSAVRAADFGAATSALCRFRSHVGRRTPGPGGFCGEPGDAAEVDDPGSLVAAAFPARENDPRMAGAPRLLRGVGDAGQLALPLAGGARSGLPAHRSDR